MEVSAINIKSKSMNEIEFDKLMKLYYDMKDCTNGLFIEGSGFYKNMKEYTNRLGKIIENLKI